MNVIAFMALIGLGLVALSVVFFIHQTNSGSGGEQDALLPFGEESFRPAPQSPAIAPGAGASIRTEKTSV